MSLLTLLAPGVGMGGGDTTTVPANVYPGLLGVAANRVDLMSATANRADLKGVSANHVDLLGNP